MSAKDEVTMTEAREVGYPTYGLDEAIKIAQAVYDLGGSRTHVKKEMLADHLKYAKSGPSFVQRIGAARAFGLIDGRGGYSLTDLGKQYFLPSNESDRVTAAFQALRSPPVFAKIVSRFEGQKLPAVDLLGNIVHTESKVPTSWKNKVASLFIKSATAIGAIDSLGALKRSNKVKPDDEEEEQEGTPAKPDGIGGVAEEKVSKAPPGTHSHVLPLANSRKLTINAPLDITPAEISRVQKWIEVTLLLGWQDKNMDEHAP